MKAPKKKSIAFPRRQWQINPATRVKPSDKRYSRDAAKQRLKKELDAEGGR
jgi:hypothetical protein